VGNYKNVGSDYRPKGKPIRVKVHDFEDKELGKVVPYGVYDVTTNADFVSLHYRRYGQLRRPVDSVLARSHGRRALSQGR
jgi:hypothetical protein